MLTRTVCSWGSLLLAASKILLTESFVSAVCNLQIFGVCDCLAAVARLCLLAALYCWDLILAQLPAVQAAGRCFEEEEDREKSYSEGQYSNPEDCFTSG